LTRRSYQHHLDTHLLPCIGNIPLAMLTAADLRVMFTAISRQRPTAGAPLSPATLARIRAALQAALNAAIREGLISVNPARLVELPAPARPHPVVWTAPREAPGARPACGPRSRCRPPSRLPGSSPRSVANPSIPATS
jgi:hypothetical protein